MSESSSPEFIIAPERTAAPDFVIRCYRPGDGAQLAQTANSSYEHLKRFMPWARPSQSVEESEKLVREFFGKYVASTDFVLGIWTSDESKLIGGTGYHLREGPISWRNAEIGMWIAADRAHQGLGTTVLRELLRWGFTAWPWERLSWWCSGSNLASRRVAEKAAMKLDGVLRGHRIDLDGSRQDSYAYSALRREWK